MIKLKQVNQYQVKVEKGSKVKSFFNYVIKTKINLLLFILGHHTVYRMSALSEDDRKDWIRALRIGSQNQLSTQRLS